MPTTREVILEAQLDLASREVKDLEGTLEYKGMQYLSPGLTKMPYEWRRGLPTKTVFDIVVNFALRFKDSINYFAGWFVELISFEDLIFITLMRVQQNHTNLLLV